MFTGPRRFNRCIQCQQVRSRRYLVDHADNRSDLPRPLAQCGHRTRALLRFIGKPADHCHRRRHLVVAVARRVGRCPRVLQGLRRMAGIAHNVLGELRHRRRCLVGRLPLFGQAGHRLAGNAPNLVRLGRGCRRTFAHLKQRLPQSQSKVVETGRQRPNLVIAPRLQQRVQVGRTQPVRQPHYRPHHQPLQNNNLNHNDQRHHHDCSRGRQTQYLQLLAKHIARGISGEHRVSPGRKGLLMHNPSVRILEDAFQFLNGYAVAVQ